ncbi:hypothetical protein C8Q77DRAFT_787085 [Trametes polyzona]|nr:hypothetical protein C8Q77DRAFT_787085 [Trametes polyzona]
MIKVHWQSQCFLLSLPLQVRGGSCPRLVRRKTFFVAAANGYDNRWRLQEFICDSPPPLCFAMPRRGAWRASRPPHNASLSGTLSFCHSPRTCHSKRQPSCHSRF